MLFYDNPHFRCLQIYSLVFVLCLIAIYLSTGREHPEQQLFDVNCCD